MLTPSLLQSHQLLKSQFVGLLHEGRELLLEREGGFSDADTKKRPEVHTARADASNGFQ